ncbi:chemotaxis protein CheW [Methanoplanus endosymbiosus]|uniref:Chemotaxis protein CheW n=1 Tax=Methanoplanus endosymbiosus TaxID=33865 RepID=A0A9E7THC5_9EURY|nr:chemotaxis protein CheW [Methanoplanus endosymbiosus]UUX92607.1 chemotaxis protein CheW [Methanoplanus endosymbiosus]
MQYPENPKIKSGSLLLFYAGDIHCAVPVTDVDNVIRMVEITDEDDPSAIDGGIAGSFSFHGKNVKVYSPAVFFGGGMPKPELTDKLIVTNPDVGNCALWVKSIDRVCSTDEFFGISGDEDKHSAASEEKSEADGGSEIPVKKLISGFLGLEIYAAVSGTEPGEGSGTGMSGKSGRISGREPLSRSEETILLITDIKEFISQGLKGSFGHISGYIHKWSESKRSEMSGDLTELPAAKNITSETEQGIKTPDFLLYSGYEFPDSLKAAEILRERKEQIEMPEGEAEESEKIEILRFRLMYAEYAVEMKYIREVLINERITPIPGIPDFIMGIFALRGEIISLVNLRVLFRLPKAGITDLNRVIILSNGELTFGILADYITDIGSIPEKRLKVPDEKNSPIDIKYIKGITDDSLIVLDAKVLLSDPCMIIDEV